MPILPIPKIMEDTTKNRFFEAIPKKKKATTGSVAPGSGITPKLPYMSFIVLLLVKYLIQYISYKTIKTTAIHKTTENSFPQNNEKTTVKTWPILSKISRILFSSLKS